MSGMSEMTIQKVKIDFKKLGDTCRDGDAITEIEVSTAKMNLCSGLSQRSGVFMIHAACRSAHPCQPLHQTALVACPIRNLVDSTSFGLQAPPVSVVFVHAARQPVGAGQEREVRLVSDRTLGTCVRRHMEVCLAPPVELACDYYCFFSGH